jgi:hypothetical protein
MIKFLNNPKLMLGCFIINVIATIITVITYNVNGLTLWFFALSVLSFAQYVNLTDEK